MRMYERNPFPTAKCGGNEKIKGMLQWIVKEDAKKA